MAAKREPIVRVTVQIKAKTKDKPAAYSYMSKATADLFGLTPVKSNVRVVKGKNGKSRPVAFRGSVGSGSIKVPLKARTSRGNKQGKISYRSIPIPAGVTIVDIQKFLQSVKKNKPDSFVTKDGRMYPVAQGAVRS
jgi:hypothetical protein